MIVYCVKITPDLFVLTTNFLWKSQYACSDLLHPNQGPREANTQHVASAAVEIIQQKDNVGKIFLLIFYVLVMPDVPVKMLSLFFIIFPNT